jgi:hypothetical protein
MKKRQPSATESAGVFFSIAAPIQRQRHHLCGQPLEASVSFAPGFA